jgi:hypothetical protein
MMLSGWWGWKEKKGRRFERVFIFPDLQPWEQFAAWALTKRRTPSGINNAEYGEEYHRAVGSECPRVKTEPLSTNQKIEDQ